ncbi:MAG: anti-sigma factor [Cytophagaceae bacterium]|nr:anti-sigma factor [Cytophagaceae bacterium]
MCFGLFTLLKDNETIVETSFGQTKTVTLIDGSEVVLNSKSKLTYDEDSWDEERLINLEGEAYFKVAKGKTFTVETNNGFVTVLGTQFNVISMNNLFDVVCYEGKVGVKTSDSQHVLMPSQSIRKIDTKPTQTLSTQLSSPTWISGESTYKSLPVRFVIKALENQYNIKIDAESIDDAVLFTGSFPNNDLKVALQTVFEPLDIKFDEKENRNIKLRY